jgi:hypothetical protein
MIAARNARLEIKWQKPTSGFTPEAILICFSVLCVRANSQHCSRFSATTASGATSQLVQAMAGFGGGSGAV